MPLPLQTDSIFAICDKEHCALIHAAGSVVLPLAGLGDTRPATLATGMHALGVKR